MGIDLSKDSKGEENCGGFLYLQSRYLVCFKYLAWILEGIIHLGEENPLTDLALPIGISFYTFQALSYVIDVYRGKEHAQTNILNVGLYISFFPQLIAGPIVRYGTVSEQLKERKHSFELFSEGAWRFIIGLSKKLLLANQLAVVAEMAFARDAAERSVLFAWVGALAFMLQIYFDFSGYSDMAIGLGKMFGFEFPENFNYPYISCSITEFWRRWHISLGAWFRDYLYIPLGGNSVSISRWRWNLFIVWMATGIWHGANWTFVIWGLIQFVFIYWEKKQKPNAKEGIVRFLGFLYTFLVTMLGWIIFNANSLEHAIQYYESMLHLCGNAWTDTYGLYWIDQYKVFLILGLILEFPVLERLDAIIKRKYAKRLKTVVQTAVICALFWLDICYAVGGGYNPFLYFNF